MEALDFNVGGKVRKLTNAELKFLKAFPDDLIWEDIKLPENIYPWTQPKGTNCKTIQNLHKLGLIKISVSAPIIYYPLCLTEKGKGLR